MSSLLVSICQSITQTRFTTTNTHTLKHEIGILRVFLLLVKDILVISRLLTVLLSLQIHILFLASLIDGLRSHLRRDERLRRLVVHRRHQSDLLQQRLQRIVIDLLRLISPHCLYLLQLRLDGGLLLQHHLLRELRVRRE